MMPESSREFRPDLAREFEYLLGHMPRVDRETFQGLLIENVEMSERVLEAENELFDAYVRGELPGEWRPSFEERLLRNETGRRKLTVARRLADRTRKSRRLWYFGSAIAAGIALIASLWPNAGGGSGHRDDKQSPPTPVEVARREVATFALSPVTRGSGARPNLTVATGITHVELKLSEPATAVELAGLNGKEPIWKSAGPPPFQVPVSLLPAGAYVLTAIENGQPSNYYEFEIIRK